MPKVASDARRRGGGLGAQSPSGSKPASDLVGDVREPARRRREEAIGKGILAGSAVFHWSQ